MEKKEFWWPKLKHFIAGSMSGIALVLAGHPFDTIKVRLQTDTIGKFNGPIDCFIKTIREEKIKGLYKGATPPMVATGFINSILFGSMGLCKQCLQNDSTKPISIKDTMLCGIFTGWFISIIVTPMEGIKAKLQVQYALPPGIKPLYLGPIDCAKKLIKNNGIKGLYIGWFPTVLHRGQNWAYFGGYEIAKRILTPPGKEGKLSPLSSIIAGAFAGTSFWLVTYPIDVIKNRMQAAPDIQPPKYKGFIDCTLTIWKEYGWKGFFKGFTPCLIRSIPANAAAFFAFEITMNLLNFY